MTYQVDDCIHTLTYKIRLQDLDQNQDQGCVPQKPIRTSNSVMADRLREFGDFKRVGHFKAKF